MKPATMPDSPGRARRIVTPVDAALISPHLCRSNRHRRANRRMRVVALDRDILEAKAENIAHLRIEAQARQRARLTRELFAGLFEMVRIEMRVAEGMHEIAGLQPRHLRDH